MFLIDKNKAYPKVTESKSIIRFQDCDPLRHLNNAKYFDYFFNAREDQVAKIYQLRPADFFFDYKANWVVYHHQISYLRPANVGEWVVIRSALIFFSEDTIVTEFYMLNEEKDTLKAVLWTTSKFVDGTTGKRTPHPQPITDYLNAILISGIDFQKITFFERIKQIKNALTQEPNL